MYCWQFSISYKDAVWWITWEGDYDRTVIRRYSETSKGALPAIATIVATLSGEVALTPYNIHQKLPFIITYS